MPVKRTRPGHPEPNGPPDRTPIKVSEVWENPVTRERATILELPWENQSGRANRRANRVCRRACNGGTPPSRSGRALHPANRLRAR